MEKNFIELCKVVKGKKAQQLINSYEYSVNKYGYRDIENCYKDCSSAKWRARNEIHRECVINDGYGFTIPSYNTMAFSCAYLAVIDSKQWLIYHTRDYRYAVEYNHYN